MKKNIFLFICLICFGIVTGHAQCFKMGNTISPSGHTFAIDSVCIRVDGKPVLPVMGEFQFSRYPASEWREELLKMKACGVSIIATYLIWIHFEEQENVFDWKGQNDLHRFVSLCDELGLKVFLRIGPWVHGEARNGGHPEWLLDKNVKLRTADPEYIKYVYRFYSEAYKQVRGMFWKDGGPIIGVQLDNEYSGDWSYFMKLKEIAQNIGFDVPIYTRTGWSTTRTPATFGELVPWFGDYPDGFWDRFYSDMPDEYRQCYTFHSYLNLRQAPLEQRKPGEEKMLYPFLTCELGGGMMTSYIRRLNISPMDIYALSICKLGNGCNLMGYYIFHGGTNPTGRFTYMNESQDSRSIKYNDLPTKSYDFQAPLGECGQIREHYHLLRRMNLFLQTYGPDLALMHQVLPADNAKNASDTVSLRWCIRQNNGSGFVFVNNYQRLKRLSDKHHVRFSVNTPNGILSFPSDAITVPSGKCFIFPFNLPMGKTRLISATVQPITKVDESNHTTWYFTAIDSIPIEMVIASSQVKQIDYSSVSYRHDNDGNFLFKGLVSGKSPSLIFTDAAGRQHRIIILSETASLHLWKGVNNGKEQVVLSEKPVLFDNHSVVYLSEKRIDGVKIKVIRAADKPRQANMGQAKIVERPHDKDFDSAAVWEIQLPKESFINPNLMLSIHYVGDVARLYVGDKLIEDNFYNGKSMDCNLKPYIGELKQKKLYLKILPVPQNALIYFQKEAKLQLENTPLALRSIELIVHN
jgi:beta-galactosidase